MPKKFLIDYEAYEKTIKEIAIYDVNNKTYENFFIKTSQHPNTQLYNWLVSNMHRIPYQYGTTHFSKIINFLNQKDAIFYIKGEEKRKLIQKYTKNSVINIEIFNCPAISKLYEPYISYCDFHKLNPTDHCALRKLHKIVHWYVSNSQISTRTFESIG